MKRINRLPKSLLMIAFSILLVGLLSTGVIAQENNQDTVRPNNIFSEIASEVDSGVVKVTSKIEVSNGNMPYYYDEEFYEYFFGEQLPEQQPRVREGYGSGFVVTEDGYIITNEHVVHNAKEINVTINGFEEPIPAEQVWADYSLDLAILKVDVDKSLNPIPLGNSNELKPGDWTIAIGNP